MAFFLNKKGKLLTVEKTRYIFTELSGNPILVTLCCYEDINCNENERQKNEEDIINNFMQSNLVWVNGKPFHYDDLEDGTEVHFDAVFNKYIHQALLVWQGSKPLCIPFLNSGEYLLCEIYNKKPVSELCFQKSKSIICVTIEGREEKIPFTHDMIYINGNKISENDINYCFLRSHSFLADICKFIGPTKRDCFYYCCCLSVNFYFKCGRLNSLGKVYYKDNDKHIQSSKNVQIFFDIPYKVERINCGIEMKFVVDGVQYTKVFSNLCDLQECESMGHFYSSYNSFDFMVDLKSSKTFNFKCAENLKLQVSKSDEPNSGKNKFHLLNQENHNHASRILTNDTALRMDSIMPCNNFLVKPNLEEKEKSEKCNSSSSSSKRLPNNSFSTNSKIQFELKSSSTLPNNLPNKLERESSEKELVKKRILTNDTALRMDSIMPCNNFLVKPNLKEKEKSEKCNSSSSSSERLPNNSFSTNSEIQFEIKGPSTLPGNLPNKLERESSEKELVKKRSGLVNIQLNNNEIMKKSVTENKILLLTEHENSMISDKNADIDIVNNIKWPSLLPPVNNCKTETTTVKQYENMYSNNSDFKKISEIDSLTITPCLIIHEGSICCILNTKNKYYFLNYQDICTLKKEEENSNSSVLDNKKCVFILSVQFSKPLILKELVISYSAVVAWQGKRKTIKDEINKVAMKNFDIYKKECKDNEDGYLNNIISIISSDEKLSKLVINNAISLLPEETKVKNILRSKVVSGIIIAFEKDKGIFRITDGGNIFTDDLCPNAYFNRSVAYIKEDGKTYSSPGNFELAVKSHIRKVTHFKAKVYQCIRHVIKETSVSFSVLMMWKNEMYPIRPTFRYLLPRAKNIQNIETASQKVIAEKTGSSEDLKTSMKSKHTSIDKLPAVSMPPISKKAQDNSVDPVLAVIKELNEKSGKLKLDDQRKLYEFSRDKCFLYGINLNQFSLMGLLIEGDRVEVIINELNEVDEVWIGDGPQKSPLLTYKSVLEWCNVFKIEDNLKIQLISECDWVPSSCKPIRKNITSRPMVILDGVQQ